MLTLEYDLVTSLNTCDLLTDEWEEEQCHGGVFMENVLGHMPLDPAERERRDTRGPLYTCIVVDNRYKNRCYLHAIAGVLGGDGSDFTKGFNVCSTVSERFRAPCYEGLGVQAAARSEWTNLAPDAQAASTDLICDSARGREARASCVSGAVKEFLYRFHGRAGRASAFCRAVDAAARPTCYRVGEEFSRARYNKPFDVDGENGRTSAPRTDQQKSRRPGTREAQEISAE